MSDNYVVVAPSRREMAVEPDIGEILFQHCDGLIPCLTLPMLPAAFRSWTVADDVPSNPPSHLFYRYATRSAYILQVTPIRYRRAFS